MLKWVRLLKKVEGLPYKVGQLVPVHYVTWNGQCLWHVWKTIIRLPSGSYHMTMI